MDRRSVIGRVAIASVLFSVLGLVITASAWAQQPTKMPKVAILSPRAPTTQSCDATMQESGLPCFVDAMRELGYVDGKNASFEFRYAEDDYKKLPSLATELVRLRPDVIYTAGPGAAAAANATSAIPIIAGPTGEETLTRLAGNFAHPTGNVAFLLNPDSPAYRDYPGVLASAAGQLGVTIIRIEARNLSDLPQAFAAIAASGADAVVLVDDPTLAGTREARKQVIEQGLSRRLPVASPNSSVAPEGGLCRSARTV